MADCGGMLFVCMGACFEEKNLCSKSSIRLGLTSEEWCMEL